MLAFAGIPLTSGFAAKFAVFGAAVGHGGTSGVVLAVIGVLCSAITVFVYVRIIVMMYFTAPTENAVHVVSPSILGKVGIGFGAAMTLALGVAPASLFTLAEKASQFLS
jgi:NADH-quinone oxidoreductase subunit N